MTDGRVCCLLPSPLLFWHLLSFVLPHPVVSPAVVNYLLMSFTCLLLTLPWINTCSLSILSAVFHPKGFSAPRPPGKYLTVPLSVRAKAFQQRSLKFPWQFDPVYRRLSCVCESSLVNTPVRRQQLIKCRRWQKENVHANAAAVRGKFCLHSVCISLIFLGLEQQNEQWDPLKAFIKLETTGKSCLFFYLLFIYFLILFHLYIRAFSCEWSSNLRVH